MNILRHLPVTILSRHLLGLYALSFSRVISLFLLLLMLLILLRQHDLIIEFGASGTTLAAIVLLSVPKLLTVAIPFSAIIAATRLVQSLEKQNELVIMRQAGLSNAKLLRPVAALGCLLALLGWLNGLVMIPLATQERNIIKRSFNSQEIRLALNPGKFNYLGSSTMFYARELDEEGHYLGVMIVQIDDNVSTTILADRGQLNTDLNQLGFLLFDGSVQKFDSQSNVLDVVTFDAYQASVSKREVDQISYWLSSNERFLPDLLFPDLENKIDHRRYHELISKGHDRLIAPMYFLLLPLIAALLMINAAFDRRFAASRMASSMILCFAVLIAHRLLINAVSADSSQFWMPYCLLAMTVLVTLVLWRHSRSLHFDFVGALFNSTRVVLSALSPSSHRQADR